MANSNINLNCSVPANLSLKQYDLLIESIAKADALLQVALAVDLEEISSTAVLYNFLWCLHDILYPITDLCSSLESQQKATAEVNHG